MKRWYCCSKCNEVADYEESGEWTSFPRGEWMVHRDFITTGFKSKAKADEWLKWETEGKAKGEPMPGIKESQS